MARASPTTSVTTRARTRSFSAASGSSGGWNCSSIRTANPHRGYVGLIDRTFLADSTVGSQVRTLLKNKKIQVALNGTFGLGMLAGLGTIGLSLIILGLLDNAALAPLAGVAIADAQSWTVRAGFLVVAVAGVLAAVVVAMVPKFTGMRRVMRFRVGRWLSEHTQCRKESMAALLLIFVSWALRGTAVFLLL